MGLTFNVSIVGKNYLQFFCSEMPQQACQNVGGL